MNIHGTSILSHEYCPHSVSPGGAHGKEPPANTGDVRDAGSIPDPGIEPVLADGYFTTKPPRKPKSSYS